MLSSNDITTLLSRSYADSALRFPDKMLLIAEMLETMRPQMGNENIYQVFDYLKLDKTKFGNDSCIAILTELRQAFFESVFENQLKDVQDILKQDDIHAENKLRQYFAEAFVHFREDFICILSKKSPGFNPEMNVWIEKISKTSGFLAESRWIEAYPFYQEIYNNPNIQAEERCRAEVISGQIVLYYFPDPLLAETHFQNATKLLPDNLFAKRGWGEFFQKSGDRKKARELYMEVITKEPHDFNLYHLVGDCFMEENRIKVKQEVESVKKTVEFDFSNEEYWYNSGWEANFLQPDSCKRLIGLYSQTQELLQANENKIAGLLHEVEKLDWYPRKNRFRFTDKIFSGCFNDTALYMTLKDLALSYQEVKLFDKSEEVLLKAVKLQPNLSEAYIELGKQKNTQGQYSKSLKYFKKAEQLGPDNYDVYWGMANLYESMKNKSEAINAYENCKKLRPEWTDWVNNFIGNVYFDFKEFELAGDFYRKAMIENPSFKIYQDNLWLAIENNVTQNPGKELPQENASFLLKWAEEKNDAKFWNRLGNIGYKQKKYSEAYEHYKKAIALNTDEPIYLENLGLVYKKQGLNDMAEKTFSEAVKLNTSDGGSLNQLGLFYYDLGNYDKSIELYKQALLKEPENNDYIYNMAIAYDVNQDTDNALIYYLKLSEKENKDSIQNKIGLMYFRKTLYESAINYFKNAAKLDKNNPIYLENIASAYRLLLKTDLEEKYLKTAIEIKSDDAYAFNELGKIYYDKKKYDLAVEYFNNAISFDSSSQVYYENLAYSYHNLGKTEEAIINFKKSLDLNKDNFMNWYELGNIYSQKRDFINALDCYQKVMDINPEDKIVYGNIAMTLLQLDKVKETEEIVNKAHFDNALLDQLIIMLKEIKPGIEIEKNNEGCIQVKAAIKV